MKIKILDRSFANLDYKNPIDINFLSMLAETEDIFNKVIKI